MMVTDINIVPHNTEAPRKPDGRVYDVVNYRLHGILLDLSRSIFSKIKSHSNNMIGEVVPREVASYWKNLDAMKASWDFAIDNNNPPTIAHEVKNKVVLPTYEEVQKIANQKYKHVALEEMRMAEVILASDAASSGANIGEGSKNDIESQFDILEKAMDLYMGKGGAGPKDITKTGQAQSVFKHLGVPKPDFDLDYARVAEPSPDAPVKGRPDVADFVATGD